MKHYEKQATIIHTVNKTIENEKIHIDGKQGFDLR